MPILNYTTQIKSEKTIAEIQKILSSKGAPRITTEYDADLDIYSLKFQIWKRQIINNSTIGLRGL